MRKGKIKIDENRCKGCTLCIPECKVDEIRMSTKVNKQGYTIAEFKAANKCTACTLCAIVCPEAAIEVFELLEDDK